MKILFIPILIIHRLWFGLIDMKLRGCLFIVFENCFLF